VQNVLLLTCITTTSTRSNHDCKKQSHILYNSKTTEVLAIHVSQTPAPFCRPVGVVGWEICKKRWGWLVTFKLTKDQQSAPLKT
jgi:hypothetical protein